MPCVLAVDLVVSDGYVFKFSKEDIIFLNKTMN